MITFDLAAVRAYTADVEARIARCDDGEECATASDGSKRYAILCYEFREACRDWMRAVFAGRLDCQPEVERLWLDQGHRLHAAAVETLRGAGQPGHDPNGRDELAAAASDLGRFLACWVTPKISVAPGPRTRLNLSDAEIAEARRRIDALPLLPADWRPSAPAQNGQFDGQPAATGRAV